jgi:hypothetical protein
MQAYADTLHAETDGWRVTRRHDDTTATTATMANTKKPKSVVFVESSCSSW